MRCVKMQGLLKYGMFFVVNLTIAGCDSQNRFVPEALSSSWTSQNFSAWDSPAWIENGFSPAAARSWRDAGFTTQQAVIWRQLGTSPSYAHSWMSVGFPTPDSARPWIQAFSIKNLYGIQYPSEAAKARDAGITPNELTSFAQAGITIVDIDTMVKVKALLPEAGSVEKAVEYNKQDVQPGGVAKYEHAKSARLARYREAIKPCSNVDSEVSLMMASPYAIVGKCFKISPLQVVQWIDGQSALATSPWVPSMTTPFYVEAEKLDQSFIPTALVIGEEPFTYQNAAGASLTAFHVKVLAWETDLDKG